MVDTEKVNGLFGKYTDEGRALIARAWEIAETNLEGQLRGNGHPFIEHPINVARIVSVEIGQTPTEPFGRRNLPIAREISSTRAPPFR